MSTLTPTLAITKAELFTPFFTRAFTRLLFIAVALFLITGCTGLNKPDEAVTTPSAAVVTSTPLASFSQSQFHQPVSIGNVP